MTDYFRDKTYLWSPEQLEEVTAEWGPEGCEIITSDMTPDEYRESMRKNPRHPDWRKPFDMNTLELAKWNSLSKMERQCKLESEGRWDPANGPTSMDLGRGFYGQHKSNKGELS